MSQTIDLEKMHLFGAEVGMLQAALAGSRRYLEFGAGGSTLQAIRQGVRTIVTVDSSAEWVGAVRQHPEIAPRLQDGSVSVLHANIGPIGDWGSPTDPSQQQLWPNYVRVAWAEWTCRGETPDLVFVDGRFRVACCLSVLLATADLVPLQRPTLLLHDAFDGRPEYRDVLEFCSVIAATGTLQHLRIRPDATPRAALALLLARQFDSR